LLKVTAFEQAISIESFEFDPFASHLVYERTWKPMSGAGKTDEKRVQELATMLEGKLAGYERILAKQKYLAGDEVTLADLFHLPYGSQLAEQGFKWLEDEAKFPNVAR
jgi:glutathione S-transferase